MLKTLIVFTVFLLAMFAFGLIIRKLLGVAQKKWFSTSYINEQHKKYDWAMRILFMILLVCSALYTMSAGDYETVWYFDMWFVLFTLIVSTEILRAAMEWKYADNKNDALATLLEMVFVIGCGVLMINWIS